MPSSTFYVPTYITVRGQQYTWTDYLWARKQYRLAKVADQVDLLDPVDVEAAKRQWPVELHKGGCRACVERSGWADMG